MTMKQLRLASRLLGLTKRLCDREPRLVSTWSPLGAAFNSRPQRKLNFSFNQENVGLFCIPELRDYTGFYLLQQQAEYQTEKLLEEVVDPHRRRKLVAVFDELSDCLCRVADMSDFVRIAHPDGKYAQAAEDACVSISGLVEKLNTNTQIYQALKESIETGDQFETDAIDQRVAKLFMFDFEQSGIHLPGDKRQRFVEINEKILMLGTYFMQSSQTPVQVLKSHLPEHLRYVFNIQGDNIMVNGLFSDHHSEMVREAAYKIYLFPEKNQLSRLENLLDGRDKLAKLVGFPTYAHRALRGTMGGSPELVTDFLTGLAEHVKPRAEADFAEMKKIKAKHGAVNEAIMPWDCAYYSGLARHEKCLVNNSDLAPFFSLGSCMEGLNHLFQSLFGVTLKHEDLQHGEMWSPDIHKIAVMHESEGFLGYIYCDFFERPGKPHQDCHFTIRGGRQLDDGSYQNPVVVLMLNLPPPRGRVPSQLTPGMVENLFHEFGHAMHSMLGRTRYQHVTGTRCPTDFAEVPSVLMEYFANDFRVLSKFARHWQTGEPLPYQMVHNLCQAKKLFSASEIQLQVFYSLLDQAYHGKHPLEEDTMGILANTQNKYYSLPYVLGTAWHLRFSHFVGYGAKYYSYLMSRAVASRIWQTCFKKDPFNRSMGEKYRQKMLVHGGGVHPTDLVKDMLDETPDTAMLVQALIDDLDDK